MSEAMPARIMSRVPGRIRVKVSGPDRADAVDGAAVALAEREGVRELRARPEIGSLTIHYDEGMISVGEILLALRDLGLAIGAEIAGDPGRLDGDLGQSESAVAVTTLLSRVDQRLSRVTGRKLDLKLLFPLGFFAVGMRNTFANGLGIWQVPGYVMLWYAFDAFYKLHQEDPAKPKGEQKAKEESAEASTAQI